MSSAGINDGSAKHFRVRDVRRSERESYLALGVDNAGQMDRDLGLVDNARRDMRYVFSPGTWFLLRILRLFGKAPVRFLVAEADGKLVGTTITALGGPWAYVAAVGVSPSHRQQGIAKALVSRAEEIGRAARKPWLVLDVDSDNAPALKLYSGLGLSSGLRTGWWRLPMVPSTTTENSGEKAAVRPATKGDKSSARSCSETSLPLPLPPRNVHPLELICQSPGTTSQDWATGPEASLTYFVRAYFSEPGASSFILCVPGRNPSTAEARAAISAARDYLIHVGAKDIFAPVREPDPITTLALEDLRSTRMVTTETWWKPLR
jgi:ribosomal protein S18 acetylase RimI-like enzyme